MKLFFILFLAFNSLGSLAQNVGIGTTSPSQKLSVNGKLKISDDATTPDAGTIRWNNSTQDFEGFNGTQWLSLTQSKGSSWSAGGCGNGEIGNYVQATSLDGLADDNFGNSVNINGNYAIIGAYKDDLGPGDEGSAYIFVRNGTNWIQQAKLIPQDGGFEDNFGTSVAINGDYAIVGSPGNNTGAAYIFVRSGVNWIQQTKLMALDGIAGDLFGSSVSLNGDYAIVGAYWSNNGSNTNQGAAYVFIRNGTSWTQQSKLMAAFGAPYDLFGFSVDIDGDYAIVGAIGRDALNGGTIVSHGAAYIFIRSGTSWSQQAIIYSVYPQIDAQFGYSVAIKNEYAIVGAPWYNHLSDNSGTAYVFKRTGSNWSPQATLFINGENNTNSFFGYSVDIDGNYIMIGSYAQVQNTCNCNQGNSYGKIYIYKNENGLWGLYKQFTDPGGYNGDFGSTIAIDSVSFIAGCPSFIANGNNGQGKVIFGSIF